MPAPKPSTVEQVLRPSPARQAQIDRYGEVDRRRNLWKPRINPYQAECEELEAEFLTWATDTPANQSTVMVGQKYQVEITARGFQQKFSEAANAAAYKLLRRIKGLDMMQYFSVTLAEAKVRLGKAWLEKNVPKLQTGPRDVNVVPLSQAMKGKAA